jgi:DNA-binding transcriptional LysR family regulator
MSLKYDDLHVFALVAREESVTRAADILYMSQQSVSERIRTLERLVGTKLFKRSPRGMELTPAGRALLPYAGESTALLDEGLRLARNGTADDIVKIHLHAATAPATQHFTTTATHDLPTTIDHHHGTPHSLLAALSWGQTDLAIGPFPPHSDHLTIQHLWTDPLTCTAPPDHPLTTNDHTTLAELLAHTPTIDVWGIEGEHFTHLQLQPNTPQTTQPVAIGPRSAVHHQLNDNTLTELTVIDLPPWKIDIHLAYRNNDTKRPALQDTLDALTTHATKHHLPQPPPRHPHPDEG